MSFSFLSLFRQCQQLPLWMRRARMGSQIRKLCRGNVASGSACRTSLGRLPCNQRKVTSAQGGGTVQLQHLCGLFAQARWHVPPHVEVTEDYPENYISVSAIGSPLSDSNNHKNFFSFSFLFCPLPSYCNLIVLRRQKACSYLPRTVY